MAVPVLENQDYAEGNSVTSLQLSFTIPAGSNRYLRVAVTASNLLSGATYGGTALSSITDGTVGPNGDVYAEYERIAPTQGTAQINVTSSSSCNITYQAMAWSGVNQTTPQRAPGTSTLDYSFTSSYNSTYSFSLATDELAVVHSHVTYSEAAHSIVSSTPSGITILGSGNLFNQCSTAAGYGASNYSAITWSVSDGAQITGSALDYAYVLQPATAGGDTITSVGWLDSAISGASVVGNEIAGPLITFVAAGTAAHGNNAAVTPGLPAYQAGDLLLCFAAIRNDGTGSPNTPTGYTSLWANRNMRISGKIAGASETAPSQTFTGGATNATTSAQMASFRGTHQTIGSVVAHSSAIKQNASAQNIASQSLTVTTNRCAVISFAWKQDDWTSISGVAAGMTTEIGEPASTLGSDQGIVWDYVIQDAATNIAAGTFTVSGGAAAISNAGVIAIQPPTTTNRNIHLGSIPLSEGYGTLTISLGTGALTVSPSGLASAEAFGTHSVRNATIQATGIAATLVFGTANIQNASILTTGIASSNLFGTARLDRSISPTGIAPTAAFGTTTLAMNMTVTGISSAEVFGTANIQKATISPAGLAATVVFGTPNAQNASILSAGAIGSAEAFGSATASNTGGALQSIDPAGGIASAEAFGTANLQNATIQVTGLAPGVVFGAPTLNMNVAVTGIASGEAFGTLNIQRATVQTTGIASSNLFGTARLDLALNPTGILSAEAFGSHAVQLVQTITATGIGPTLAFGTTTLSLNVTCTGIAPTAVFGSTSIALSSILNAGAIASAEAFGTAVLSLGGSTQTVNGIGWQSSSFGLPLLAITVNPTGWVNSSTFGSLMLEPGISVVSIAPTVAFGSPDLSRNIVAQAIASGEAFGNFTTTILRVEPTAFANVQSFGDLYIYNTLQFITVSGLASGESVQMPTLTGGNAPTQTFFALGHARRAGKGMSR